MLPERHRLGEIALKAGHLGLRQLALAPEQVRARRLRDEARAMAAAGTLPTGGPRVLFFTPRDWAVHVAWETTLGAALRRRGADVRVMTCGGGLDICDRTTVWEAPPMPCRTCTRYVEGTVDAHGFTRVSLRERWEGADDTGWPELDELSLAELPEVHDEDGLALGRLVDIAVRWFLLRADLAGDPLGPVTYRRFLRSARRVAVAVRRVLEEQRPDVVVLLNGLFFFEAVALEVCRELDIDVVTYERGMIADTIFVRRNALALFGEVGDVWPRWRQVPLAPAEEEELDAYLEDRRHGRRSIDTYWRDARFDVEAGTGGPGRRAVLFTNLTWDSAVIGRELAFPTLQAWLEATLAWFAEHPEHSLVVRIHPAEEKLSGRTTREPMGAWLAQRTEPLPANVAVVASTDPMSSYPLMDEADVGLVFASTTGLELALRGKPVVVAAHTHYRGKGFTTDVASPEAYVAALDAVMASPGTHAPSVDEVRRYAYLFFFRSPFDAPGVEEHVPGLARLTVEHLDELAPGRHADLDTICRMILEDEDVRP